MLRQIFAKASSLGVASLLSMALGLVVIPLMVRELGVSIYGDYILTVTFCIVLSLIVNSRSWEVILSSTQYSSKSNVILPSIILDVIYPFILFFSSLLLFPFYADKLGLAYDLEMVIIVGIITATMQVNWPQGILRKNDKIKTLAVLSFISPLCRLVLILLVSSFYGLSLNAALIIHAVSEGLKFFVFHVVGASLLKNEKLEALSSENVIETFKHCCWLNLVPIFDLPSRELDKVIVSLYFGNEVVAIYHIIKKMTAVISLITTPVYQILYPYITRYKKESNFKDMLSMLKKLVLVMSLGVVFMIAIFILAAKPINSWIFDGALNGYLIFATLYLTSFGFAAAFSPLHPVFNVIGYYKYTSLLCLISNCIYLIVVVNTVSLGLYAILVGFILQSTLLLTIKGVMINRYIHRRGGKVV
jgi:PST family polysaccharide transporter